jgi:glycine/D-amino acid oxidase-like deaminating enzyme
MGRSGGGDYQNYIKRVNTSSAYAEINDPNGGLVLGQSGYVDLNTLMDHYALWLEKQDRLTNEAFDENRLKISNRGITYKNIQASTLVYCNGMGAINSRFFTWLPLKPNKGEILVIKQAFATEEIINRGIFRITLPNKDFKVGSTYNFREFNLLPTEEGKNELLEKLQKLISLPVKGIVEHKTGIRPTTMDRKPILGKHPEYGNVYIFNGLGAKGVSLAPYFSKIMLEFLLFKKEPHKEVNISRFFDYI